MVFLGGVGPELDLEIWLWRTNLDDFLVNVLNHNISYHIWINLFQELQEEQIWLETVKQEVAWFFFVAKDCVIFSPERLRDFF